MRPFTAILLLLALAVGACRPAAPAEEPPLKGARMGGHFTLTDQDGRRVSDSQFAGRYRIVYFGYTFCPDVCPIDMRVIGAGLRQFEASDPARGARIQPIFITVDPARDTPAVLRAFVANFHPRLIGLTGSPAEIEQVARAYGVTYMRGQQTGAGYLMDHSRYAILYGPTGEPIVILPNDQGPAGIARELDHWVS